MLHQTDYIEGITSILVRQEVIPEKEKSKLIQSFKDVSQERFDYFLLDEGLVSSEQLLKALSEYYKVPSFDVVDYFFNQHLLHMFPKDLLLRNAIIPAELEDDILMVVAADPSDQNLLEIIGNVVSYDIRFSVGLHRDICDAVKEFYDQSITQEEEDESGDEIEDFEDTYEFEIEKEGSIIDEDREEW